MAQLDRETLKEFFEAGDFPTEAQFADFIDSVLNFIDDGNVVFLTGNQTIAGEKTFSNNLKVNAQANGGSHTQPFDAAASFNFNNGNSQKMTLTANVTSLAVTNKVNGGSYLIYLVQDGTGGWTIPTPGASLGNKTDNSADFITGINAVNMININVDVDGNTFYTVETYTP